MRLSDNQRSEVFMSLGAASMCWTGAPSGTFDTTRCERIGNNLIAALEEEKALVATDIQQLKPEMPSLQQFINWVLSPPCDAGRSNQEIYEYFAQHFRR